MLGNTRGLDDILSKLRSRQQFLFPWEINIADIDTYTHKAK